MEKLSGRILTERGFIEGSLYGEHGRIVKIEGKPAPEAGGDTYLLPGFIDLHVHGGGGCDFMAACDEKETISTIAKTHAKHGTTALLATTMTAPMAEIASVLELIGKAEKVRTPHGARLLGVHLEGPFINPNKLGAQPDCAALATQELLATLLDFANIRVVTLAPEIDGHDEAIAYLSEKGVRVQIGHSSGSYEDGVAALQKGVAGFTHLFNAMSPLHHREPGMVGAALAHANYAELIPDLLHVHKGAIFAALRAIPHLYCVTDATSATGMPDGNYRLGSHTVHKCLGGVRLADGTLAGSCLTMSQAFANLVSLGLPLQKVSEMLSQYPADYLGISDRGRLKEGAFFDVLRFSKQLELTEVYLEGEKNHVAHA